MKIFAGLIISPLFLASSTWATPAIAPGHRRSGRSAATNTTVSALANTGLLIPLYLYPGTATWTALYEAASAHPSVRFDVIVNPSSGPRAYPNPPGSDLPPPVDAPGFNADWTAAVKKLNALGNARALGYVHVLYGARPRADVAYEVDLWARWATDPAAGGARIDGIFFDESGGDAAALPAMAEFVAAARAKLGRDGPVVLNTGGVPSAPDYWTLGGGGGGGGSGAAPPQVVVWETCLTSRRDGPATAPCPDGTVSFDLAGGDGGGAPAGLDLAARLAGLPPAAAKSQAAVLVHDASEPLVGGRKMTPELLETLVRGTVDAKVGALCFVPGDWHAAFDQGVVGIKAVAAALAKAQGVA